MTCSSCGGRGSSYDAPRRRYRCRATPHLSSLRQQRPHSLRLLRRLRARAGTNLRRIARALPRPRLRAPTKLWRAVPLSR